VAPVTRSWRVKCRSLTNETPNFFFFLERDFFSKTSVCRCMYEPTLYALGRGDLATCQISEPDNKNSRKMYSRVTCLLLLISSLTLEGYRPSSYWILIRRLFRGNVCWCVFCAIGRQMGLVSASAENWFVWTLWGIYLAELLIDWSGPSLPRAQLLSWKWYHQEIR